MKKNIFLVIYFFAVCGTALAQIDTACQTSSNDYVVCEQNNEPRYMNGSQSIAVRKANTLTIKLTNKTTLTFTNAILDSVSPKYDSVKTFIFKKHYRENNVVVVERITNNGAVMLVVNLNTGKKVETNWLPVFSPDNKRFAVVSGTEYNTYSPEMVEIYLNKKGDFEKEFEFKPDGALSYLGACKWQGNDRLAVKRVNYAKINSTGKPLKSDITLAIIDNKWNVMGK
ncbi:MAG: hypothetical protein SGJ10_00220 [Bacteroidota bacterium]|nr:hypothetical protein [Bacteroidota bacterium]